MITYADLERSVLMSSDKEWARQLTVLSKIAAIDLATYRKVLDLVDQAKEELPDIDWVQTRVARARDAAVDGWVYRDES